MEKEIEIPEGYEARIEGNKVMLKKKQTNDEWVRERLLSLVRVLDSLFFGGNNPSREQCLAYLEKQKEQKSNLELIKQSWYTEGYTDGKFKKEPMWYIKTGEGGPRYEKNEKYGQPLERKPAAWSEEDKRRFISCMGRLQTADGSPTDNSDWFEEHCYKHPSWKPSKEQMVVLYDAISNFRHDNYKNIDVLESLYNDLKKLYL